MVESTMTTGWQLELRRMRTGAHTACQRFQTQGVNITTTENSSRRPISIKALITH